MYLGPMKNSFPCGKGILIREDNKTIVEIESSNGNYLNSKNSMQIFGKPRKQILYMGAQKEYNREGDGCTIEIGQSSISYFLGRFFFFL